MHIQDYIRQKLTTRQANGSYRQLTLPGNLIDFCSNDYLGFARSAHLHQLINDELASKEPFLNGSTGSRLLAGNTLYAEQLEKKLADYHGFEAGLLYNSGYDANLGLLSCLPQKGDTVIHDELCHASIIDGIRLSYATRYSFKHNNAESLQQKLTRATGQCFVVVESVYSMDGDLAPLEHLALICEQHGAALIVDEAHALGVIHKGLVNHLQLQAKVFACVVTFGKALGCHGAVVLGTSMLRNYLINFSRSFIYTTAAPLHQLAGIKMAYQLLENSAEVIANLQHNIKLYNANLQVQARFVPVKSQSAIQTVWLGENDRTKKVAQYLQNAGFDIRAILSPTVPAGTERLRICLHAFNTPQEILQLTQTLNNLIND